MINFRTIGIGAMSRLTTVGGNILLYPILISKTAPSEFSTWMIFSSFYMLIVLADFGFSASFGRYLNYAKSGSSNDFDEEKYILLANKMFFKYISLIFSIVCVLIYFFYLSTLPIESSIDVDTLVIAWFFFSISLVVNFRSLEVNGFLIGLDSLDYLYKSRIYSNVIYFFVATIALFLGFGIIGLAISKLTTSIVYYIYTQKIIYRNSTVSKECVNDKVIDKVIDKFKLIAPEALKIGLGGVGSYLMTRMYLIYLPLTMSLDDMAEYSLVFNLLALISSISIIALNNAVPKLNKLSYEGDFGVMKSLYVRSLGISGFLFFIQVIILILTFDLVMPFLGKDYQLEDRTWLVLIVFCFLFEILNQSYYMVLSSMKYTKHGLINLCIGLVHLCASLITLKLFDFDHNQILYITLLGFSFFSFFFWPMKIRTVHKSRLYG